MFDLTEKQIEEVIARQAYLENEILGADLDSLNYILWTWNGQSNFYKVNLWDYLNLSEFCKENEEFEATLE